MFKTRLLWTADSLSQPKRNLYDNRMKQRFFFTAAFLLLIFSSLIAFNNQLKKKVYKAVHEKEFTVLTTLSADLNNSGYPHKIVKVKTHEGIYLNLYQYDQAKRQHKKIDSLKLRHKHDGHYKFGKDATNLFTTDLNNDGRLEIIAPTHSEKLKPYINVVNYNPQTKRLELVPQSLFNL